MNRTLWFALATVIAAGCAKEGGQEQPTPPTLAVTPSDAIEFSAAATEHHDFTVTTNQAAWQVGNPDQSWCMVTNKTATGFRITAKPNTATTAPVPAKVTVTAGDAAPVVINVTQRAADAPADPLVEVIAFAYRDAAYKAYLCVMKPDGSDIRVVHNPNNPANPDYPDLTRMVLNPAGTKAVVQDSAYNLFVYDLNTGALTTVKLYGETWKADEAVWTPDGSRILYCNWVDQDNTTLETIKPDGTGIQALTFTGYNFGRPNYTPDGTKIVASNFLDNMYICSMKADGTALTKIIETTGNVGVDCAYPLTDSRILYLRRADGVYSLYSAGIDGSNPYSLEAFGTTYINADYLTANLSGSIISYTLFDSDYFPCVFVRSINGNTLGAAQQLLQSKRATRSKFGMIKKSLFDGLPALE